MIKYCFSNKQWKVDGQESPGHGLWRKETDIACRLQNSQETEIEAMFSNQGVWERRDSMKEVHKWEPCRCGRMNIGNEGEGRVR